MVRAAGLPEPKKPKNMRYQDLSMYEQRHADYHDYINHLTVRNCQHVRPIYDKLLPHVHDTRKHIQKQVDDLKAIYNEDICTCDLERDYRKIRMCMRDPENLTYRQGFLSLLALTGFHFGNRQNHVSKKLAFGALGALVGGWLCFPTETDEIIRELSYTAVTNICKLLNRGTDLNYPRRMLPNADLPASTNDNCPVCGRNLVEPRHCYNENRKNGKLC